MKPITYRRVNETSIETYRKMFGSIGSEAGVANDGTMAFVRFYLPSKAVIEEYSNACQSAVTFTFPSNVKVLKSLKKAMEFILIIVSGELAALEKGESV